MTTRKLPHLREISEIETAARNERDVIHESVPIILGEKRRNYLSTGHVPFKNIDDMTSDMFKSPSSISTWEHNQRKSIDDSDTTSIIKLSHRSNDNYSMAPNFFLKVKGLYGSTAIKTRQACYNELLKLEQCNLFKGYEQIQAIYDNKAYTISSTYYNSILKLYSHHLTQPSHPNKPGEYDIVELRS